MDGAEDRTPYTGLRAGERIRQWQLRSSTTLEQRLETRTFRKPILPDTTVSGFVLVKIEGRFMDSDVLDLELHPNVNEVRNVLISDMMYAGGLGTLAFITGGRRVDQNELRKTFDGARYYTDGIRVVMFFTTQPQAISDVEILDWYPAVKLRELTAAGEN